MSTQVRKICLLGEFGVGKTSLVNRFVRQQFSEKYLTTIGVKIDTKEILLEGIGPVKLIVWDIAGSDSLDELYRRYLRGAHGYLLVADGTRSHTLDDALNLRTQLESQLGALPFVGLLNKRDLIEEWELDPDRVSQLQAEGQAWYQTSALSGANVEHAFHQLAGQLVPD